jgi:hypothetical protein
MSLLIYILLMIYILTNFIIISYFNICKRWRTSVRTILVFSQFGQVLKNIKTDYPQLVHIADERREGFHNVDSWILPSRKLPQCGRIADERRERFHNVDGLRTSVEKASTMWTGCGRASGKLPQCGRVANGCRENFHNVEAGSDSNSEYKIHLSRISIVMIYDEILVLCLL